jgi:hypothetical protein
LTLPLNAIGLEHGCVQSTSRSTLKGSAVSGVFQQTGFAKLLRLVYDTAALRGSPKKSRRQPPLPIPAIPGLLRHAV